MKNVAKVSAKLAGVDFSSDESFVSDNRSPNMVNMYKDYKQTFNTAIETRPGFRLKKAFAGGIENAFASRNLEGYLFVYSDGGIYLYLENSEPLLLANCGKSPCFVDFSGMVIAYGGEEIFGFSFESVEADDDGEYTPTDNSEADGFLDVYQLSEGLFLHAFDEMARAFVPTTYLTARDGTVTEYQGVNLLTGKQKNFFQMDGSKKTCTLIPYDPSSDVEIVKVTVAGEETEGYSMLDNIVTITDTPSDMAEVEITFFQEVENAIAKCNVFYYFDERVFAGGLDNCYFWSGLSDATYFPQIAYEKIDNGPVVGFFQVSSNLLVAGKDQTCICATTLTGVETLPKTYPNYAISNTYGGSVCGEFLNDPVILTEYGLLGVSAVDYYGERNLLPRSTLVNGKMTNESDLFSASICHFREYLMILLNGNIYLANSREVFDTDDDFEYEWYFWSGIGAEEDGIFFPATKLIATNDLLMFVTENGYVGIFNTDVGRKTDSEDDSGELSSYAYADDYAVTEGGELTYKKKAIFSCFVTTFDDFGYRSFLKNSRKVGNICDLKGFSHTKCKIKVRMEGTPYSEIASFAGDYMDFCDLDFANFTFSTSDLSACFFKPSLKRFQKSQLMLYSDELYRPFGVLGIYQEVSVLGYAKK